MMAAQKTGWDGTFKGDAVPEDDPSYLLNHPAGAAERRRALAVLLASAVLFGALAPFAQVKLAPLPAFIPIYETALVVNDTITAVLLFGQYRILQSRALLVLASGYVFAAVMTVAHALTFPGLFTATGLLGAGPQSTAWLFMFWHAGFPLFVLAYAVLRRRPDAGRAPGATLGLTPVRRHAALLIPLGAVMAAASLVALATAGAPLLPQIMEGNRYTPAMMATVVSVWAFSLAALVALWRSRPHSVLDLWLMVMMCVWLFDIALSAMLNGSRFDLGFYAGRIYGLLACSVVMFELLLENGMLYARLVRMHENERRNNHELAVARDNAQAASKAKSLFLANMSHEIRTPMNAIIGLTQLVLGTPLKDTQRDYLVKVQSSSRAMLSLLNDILDYSKIEAGKVTLEQEEFSPEETIENVGNLFSVRAEEAGLDLFYEIDRDMPQRLVGDSLRLTQVLNNLVGNAIKFTAKGEIVISAQVASRDEDHVLLRFSVKDTGIGLTEEQQGRLFSSFEQADASISRKYGGTGLGLAICKRLVALMGGELSVTSEPGRGSEFTFTARYSLPHEGVRRLDLLSIRGMRTLVVDGQPTGRLLLQQMLQNWRFQVATAGFIGEAVHKLQRAQPQAPYELLLLDYKSGDADFVREARRITAERSGTPLLVAMMVGQPGREKAEAELGDMADTCVVQKPLTPSRLFDAIVSLQHGDSPRRPALSGDKLDLADLLRPIRGARVLLAEDNLVNQQVAMAFLTLGGLEVVVANNGIEAVDLVKKEDFDAVLMDMQMPDMDGVEAARVIRNLPHCAQLPILAMTAAAMDEDKQECLAAGMNAHVSKPIDAHELAHALLSWIPASVTRPGELDSVAR
jgi:two-component system sensor histidine kinase/response regulator